MTVPPYIITNKRRFVNLWEPHESQISLGDIVHALGAIARWTGHTPQFYSVAEHSVLVSRRMKDLGYSIEDQLTGLFHDAHEAYIGDISAPLEDMIAGAMDSPFFIKDIKRNLQKVICSKFNISFDDDLVEVIDEDLWAIEAFYFFSEQAREFIPKRLWVVEDVGRPLDCHITCLNPPDARHAFFELYNELIVAREEEADGKDT